MKYTENTFNPKEFESKWQEVWEKEKLFSPDIENAQNPYFNLMMFPYPSAEGLHVGNMYAFTGADVYARYNRMLGRDVLEPIGLDGFGIHSENYALKVGRHPKEQAQIAESNFYRQLRSIGNSFDWQRTVETYDPKYYKWTQWLFIQLFKAGLAYRKTALVNWCPKDLTVLSDEQVIDGCCERCGTKVEKKNLEQWFFRITNYADRLLNNIDGLNWTEKVKIAQKNWIGKSEGVEIEFKVESYKLKNKVSELRIKIFTTRPDTLFGATFMVIAPEHELVQKLMGGSLEIDAKIRDEVMEYIEKAKEKTDIERTGEGKEKTGVFSGLYAINPVNGERIPVWIADYVLSGYGTGAIMAVPAHDKRDFEFAKRYNLPIIEVIQNQELRIKNNELSEAYEENGVLMNSGEWDGLEVPKEMGKIIECLEGNELGIRKANYHLRDWLISRQRYWGPPIPMIFCINCAQKKESWFTSTEGQEEFELRNKNQELSKNTHNSKFMTHDSNDMAGWFPVPEKDLPVLLLDVEDWKPMGKGTSPLANHPEFYKTICPNCGKDAVRETDVSDTFLDSSWYFLRYPSNDIENDAFDIERTKKWLPVDMYIGGAEHSVLHLLYSRFVTMVLSDLNFIDFEEPFSTFFAHGLIIKDGAKMSKSKGNVVVPDAYIAKYGADTLRAYLMFLGPYSDGGDFRDSGIEGMYKFLRKVWKLLGDRGSDTSDILSDSPERLKMMHKTIKEVSLDIQEYGYNTAIARLMEWYNYLSSEVRSQKQGISRQEIEVYLKLLAPFAPHMTEELWQQIQNQESRIKDQGSNSSEKHNESQNPSSKFITYNSIHLTLWPQYEEKYLVSEVVTIIVQVNGKKRGEVRVGRLEIDDRGLIEERAKEAVEKPLADLNIKKTIYVPGKIVNFVV